MKRLKVSLKRFFFPPAGTSRWLKVLPYAVLGILTFVVLTAGAVGWEYTNSSEFCGMRCHTMPPEYSSYLASPHARVACVECHIGRAVFGTKFFRKAGDLRHVVYTIFQNYEYPIYASQMRPARDSCEKCHFPEKFSDDSQREVVTYANDKGNTPYSTYLIFKTGGGSKRQGLGKGIHWHVENPVYFYASDEHEQNIPYIKVIKDDGSVEEYIDIEAGFDAGSVKEEDLKQMDCITCHNRITHLVSQPEEVVDTALKRGIINSIIPEIRKKSIDVMRGEYTTQEEALSGIGALSDYYRVFYPDFYAQNQAMVGAAIQFLQETYQNSVHLEQKSDWSTHPNNLGHKDFPGCFRCHDGSHLNAEKEAIRLECNLCHSIPVVAGPYNFRAEIEISRGPEPESHKSPNWIAQHHLVFTEQCANCHTTTNPGGTSNTSFCSNSACHGSTWTFAGFDAPALREVILEQLPPTPTPKPLPVGAPLTYNDLVKGLLVDRCADCHGAGGIQGLDVTTYQALMKGGSTGTVIVTGDPQASLLVQKQTGEEPHFGQLSPEELDVLVRWIQSGAPEK